MRIEILTNRVFGKLKVLNEYKKHLGRIHWKCLCECGNFKYVRSLHLKNNATLSCGCLLKKTKNHQWRGYGDISGAYFTNINHNAKKRNIEFNLTIKDIWELFIKQEKKCYFTNIELTLCTNYIHNKKMQTASLDRIDSSKGYNIDNVIWVHKIINGMKMKISNDEFIYFCRKVTEAGLPILEAGQRHDKKMLNKIIEVVSKKSKDK